jgi:outer membrane receptor protein involved in Fe transport
MIRGRHILHFGGEILALQGNSTPWGNIQSAKFNFSGDFTKKAPFDGNSGLGYADFLLGQVQSWSANNTPITGGRQKSPQVFVQDDFKVLPNLTINLGLRYQMQRGWTEVKNRLAQPSQLR